MIARRILRLALVVGAFLVGVYATVFVVGIFFWKGYGQYPPGPYPTQQDWLDIISITVGVVLAGLVAFGTRSMTRRENADHPY